MNLTSRALVLGLLIPTACGGGDGATPDGSTSDGSTDAAVDRVTLHVWDGSGAPVAGRAVAFLGPDDAPIAEVVTDATGTAATTMPMGGSVTVAPPAVAASGSRPQMYTYLGVHGGDELFIGEPKRAAVTSFDITVSVPAGAAPTAQNFNFHSTCNLNAGNTTNQRFVTMKIRSSCATADFYVEALDAQYKPISSLYATGRAVSAGATVDVGSGFTPMQTSTLLIKNVPSPTEVTPALDQVVGDFYTKLTNNFAVTVTNGMASKSFVHGNVSGASIETRVLLDGAGSRLFVRRAPAPINATLDVTAENLPDVTAEGTYSASNKSVSWFETGSATDVSTVSLRIRADAARDFTWMIVGPHITSSLHVPTLPASFNTFAIAATDTVTVVNTAIAAVPGGYDRVRPLVLRSLDGLGTTTGFFEPFQGANRLEQLGYLEADGQTAIIAASH